MPDFCIINFNQVNNTLATIITKLDYFNSGSNG